MGSVVAKSMAKQMLTGLTFQLDGKGAISYDSSQQLIQRPFQFTYIKVNVLFRVSAHP
jgi:hypothetical protein